jgi:hypothetical protein
MAENIPNDRQIDILRVVLEGAGDWNARWIDITVSRRYGPAKWTVLSELQELEALGLVKRDTSREGIGGIWAVTEAALAYIA